MIEFFLVCVPPSTNHHSKRIIRIGGFMRLADTPDLQAAKEAIDALLMAHRPARPMVGPLTLTLEYTWPWNKGESKRKRARHLIPRASRPDCSNLAKTTEDRLAALRFMEDDNQVVELVVRKFFGDHPGIGVLLEPCLDPVQRILPPMAVSEPREVGLLL